VKVYISGGIAGFDRDDRLEAFGEMEIAIQRLGHETVNPFDCVPEEHEGECPQGYAKGEGHSSACHLRADLMALLDCDAVFMMRNWELSRGARLEHSVAADCGLQIYYELGKALSEPVA